MLFAHVMVDSKGGERVKKVRTKLGRARLRVRKAKLDAKITRDKRDIKSFKRRLRKRNQILSRRLRARAKLK
jgi:peptidoglycan hydrolase CwlO-like protein